MTLVSLQLGPFIRVKHSTWRLTPGDPQSITLAVAAVPEALAHTLRPFPSHVGVMHEGRRGIIRIRAMGLANQTESPTSDSPKVPQLMSPRPHSGFIILVHPLDGAPDHRSDGDIRDPAIQVPPK